MQADDDRMAMGHETEREREGQEMRRKVRAGYAKLAVPAGEEAGAGIGRQPTTDDTTPASSRYGLSCGHPVAEAVLDLGCGRGGDVFEAGQLVGPTGCVIGVDMTAEMLDTARKGIETYTQDTRLHNVEFRLGEIEHLPVRDGIFDVVLSNCVINLSPDKGQVWREIRRALKPGGRVCVSDVALLQPLPDGVRVAAENWIGCVSGAELIPDYIQRVAQSGLVVQSIESDPSYTSCLGECSDPFYARLREQLRTDPSDYIASVTVRATKPAPLMSDLYWH
ncbi:hypothetical protein KIPB_005379 [Kipferlia bialata]|uniref:Arsenite methyltransferase n=1 Tax=Kipferlia bialata TaxID=797122 RepID=A0A9K3CVH8_9EUKA|nr:hypothetical protein KIPB_005379 [Kipferlia bialata]|eukprot:g5379.t1